MGVSEKQPEGIQFTGLDGKITIHDLDLNRVDDDNDNSNASNKSFVHDKEYQRNLIMTREKKIKISIPTKPKKIISTSHSNNTMRF